MTRKLTFLILALFALISGPGWGQTTYTMQSYSNNVITSDNNATWATSSACGGSELPYALNSKRGAGFQADNTVTSSISVTNASKITVIASSNGNKTTTLAVKVGNTKFGETISLSNANYQSLEFTAPNNTTASGTIEFTITHSSKTLWIGQVIVETATPSTDPSITVNPTSIDLGTVNIGEEALASFTVSQANLTSNISLNAENGNLNPENIVAGAGNTEVTYTITPNAAGEFSDVITISCTDLENDIEINVSGNAIDPSVVETYEKITSAPANWEGEYLLVYENGNEADVWTGIDAQNCYVTASINNNSIEKPQGAVSIIISAMEGGYSIKVNDGTNNGKFISGTSGSNTLNFGNEAVLNTLSYTEGSTMITSNTSVMRFNSATNNLRFRYFKSTSYSSQQPVQLYKKVNSSSVATPTFTPAGGTYTTAQNVTITCATEGASIYYTLDGTTPTDASTRYTSAITVSETKTIKAIAYSQTGGTSSVASATYTIAAPLTTMDAIFAKATEAGETETDVYVTFNNWVISGVKGNNAYLTDGTKGLIIYENGHGFTVGDKLTGTAACKVQLYRGAAELTTLTSSTDGLTVTEGGSVTAQEFNINDLSGINTGAIITVNNVTYSGSNNIFTDDDENEIKAYNTFMTLPSFTSGRQYNITGVYIQYDETKEIAPRTNEDIVEIASTEPSITVAETLNLPYTESEVETLEVSYENVDFEMLDLYFYDDAECTIESENDWFDADFAENGSFNIEYLASENTESTPRTVYMQIYYLYNDGESELTKVITVTQEAAPQTYNVTLSSNGVVDPQPVQGSITLSDPTNIPTGFTFAGWTESESNIQIVDNPYTPTSDVTLFAVFSREEGGIAGSGNYEKVTSNPEDWSGEYLIVYENETNAFAFDGSLQTLDATNNSISVQIENNSIESNSTTNAAKFTIEPVNGGYSIQSSSGYYIGRQAKSNGISTSKTNAFINVLTYTESTIKVTNYYASENLNNYLKYNSNNDQKRFRYFTSDSQNDIQLYKKDEGTPGVTKYYTRVFDEDTELASLTVAGPSIILSGYTLTVTGTMSNSTASNLIIEDGAQLIQNSSNVKATVQKNITGYTGDNDNYYLIANPTANAVGEEDEYDALDGCTTFDLYTFDPTAELEWVNIGQTAQKVTFDRNVGYLYANAQDMTLHFRGYLLPTNETTNINLVYYTGGEASREFPGFNLIGNPYTCNAYVNGYNFYTMADGEFVINEGSATIAPSEGFFVEATPEDQSVTLSTTAPVTAPNALSLNVSQNRGNVIDRAIVNFNGSNNLHKFMMNPAHTNLSIAKGGETFAAISTEAEGELPVNFKAEKNGTYTITVNTKNVDAEYLHLIDNMTGMDVDLLSTPSYTFEAKTSDYASRFKLVFGVNNTASESSDSNFAFMSDGNLVIDNINGEATLQIVDELGRVISTETVSGSYNKALNLKAGLYIINLNGMTQKIVVE